MSSAGRGLGRAGLALASPGAIYTVLQEAEHRLQKEVQKLRKVDKEHNQVVYELTDAQTQIYCVCGCACVGVLTPLK